MNDALKITSSHLARVAIVYLSQSSAAQVENNRESTGRQYALVNKAADLGWVAGNVMVIDEDLGLSGSGAVARSGFARLTAEVALGHVGLVLGLEVSRLARNNADWYRLIDLCGLANTLIGDADGVYHPALFNDRLLLGLKGTRAKRNFMSFGPASTAGSATRRPAASCGAACLSGLSGATPTAKSDFIPMTPSGRRSPGSFLVLPRRARLGAFGYGSDPRGCAYRFGCTRGRRSYGSTPATTRSIRF